MENYTFLVTEKEALEIEKMLNESREKEKLTKQLDVKLFSANDLMRLAEINDPLYKTGYITIDKNKIIKLLKEKSI